MHQVHLNGADPEKIAKIMGGTLIMHNTTDDIATISGGDVEKLRHCEARYGIGESLLPQYDPETDGDYESWLVANNMD